MPKIVNRVPQYCHIKSTDQAVVYLFGKRHYLGKYGTPESRERYRRLLAELEAERAADAPREVGFGESPTVAVVVSQYLSHCKSYYRVGDKEGTEVDASKRALKFLLNLYSCERAENIGPKSLKAVRHEMIKYGLCRRSINYNINRIRRMFKWAASEELIPANVYLALCTVRGLRKNESGVHDLPKVEPASIADIEAIEPFVMPQVWAIVQFALWTGCRPGEACRVKMSEIDTSHDIWEFRPSKHKNAHRDLNRVIFLGPHARALVEKWKRDDPDEYLWQPIEARDIWEASRRRDNGRKKKRKRNPKRPPRNCYTTSGIGKAIAKACKRAKVSHWSPGQLRHTAGTKIRATYGVEAARIILGHTNLKTTEIYAERDREAIRKIMTAEG